MQTLLRCEQALNNWHSKTQEHVSCGWLVYNKACEHFYGLGMSGIQYCFSSSVFPTISLGFNILGEIFAYVTVF